MVQYSRQSVSNTMSMIKYLLSFTLLFCASDLLAQKVDSIYFHLYTDSLKKGQHNYINIDGKLSNGNWLPMTSKDLVLTSSHGNFQGNELYIPENFSFPKVTVKASLKSNPSVVIERTIWIKTLPDPPLPPYNNSPQPKRGRNRQ